MHPDIRSNNRINKKNFILIYPLEFSWILASDPFSLDHLSSRPHLNRMITEYGINLSLKNLLVYWDEQLSKIEHKELRSIHYRIDLYGSALFNSVDDNWDFPTFHVRERLLEPIQNYSSIPTMTTISN